MCFSGEFGKDGEEVVDEFEKNAAINTSGGSCTNLR